MGTKNKLINIFLLISIFLLTFTQAYAEYTGPNASERRYEYGCGQDCRETMGGCGWEQDYAYGCMVTICEPKTCSANYADASISISASCSTGFGADGWCAGTVSITLTGTDAYKGIVGFESSAGESAAKSGGETETHTFTYSDNQNRTIEYWAKSGLGDTSEKASFQVKIDKTTPVNNINISGNLSPDNWYYGAVTITSTSTDAYGEIKEKWVDGGGGAKLNAYTIPESYSGYSTPKAKTVDKAGNVADWTTYPQISIDNTKPNIINTTNPGNVWFKEGVNLSVEGEDYHSGVKTAYIFVDGNLKKSSSNPASMTYTEVEGWHQVTYQVEDKATNKSAIVGPFSFGYDVTQPQIALSADQIFDMIEPTATVSGTVTDNSSGIKSVEIKTGRNASWKELTNKPGQGSTSGDWSYTFDATTLPVDEENGNTFFAVRTTDVAGNVSDVLNFTLRFDRVAPVNDIKIEGNTHNGWYYGLVKVTSVAHDTFGQVKQEWVDLGFGVKEKTDTLPATYSGVTVPKSKSVDLAGNVGDWVSFNEIRVDNEKPAIVNLTDPQGKWFSGAVSLSVFGKDDYSGVMTGRIFVDDIEQPATGNAASMSWTGAEGTHTVKYQVEDFAGNKSEFSGPYSFGFDVTPPSIELSSNQSFDIVGPVVTVSGPITDNYSGFKTVEIRYGNNGAWMPVTGQPATGTTSGTWSHIISADTAEGFNIFYVRAVDIANNTSDFISFSLKKDHTAPETIGMHTEGSKGEGGVYYGQVSFIGEASDSVAGVRNIFVDLGLGDGEKANSAISPSGYTGNITACVRAVDNVGNSTECIPQDAVLIDNTKPYIVDYTRFDSSASYNAQNEISVNCADDHAGMYSVSIVVDGTAYTANGSSHSVSLGELSDGTHNFVFILTDNAGNIFNSAESGSYNSVVLVDKTAPSLIINKPVENDYFDGELSVHGTASDNINIGKIVIMIDGSTVREITVSGTSSGYDANIDISGYSEGCHVLEIIAINAAGNAADPVSKTFCIDRTAPEISGMQTNGVKGDGGVFRGIVSFAGEAADPDSGIASVLVDLGLGNGEQPSPVSSPEGFSGIIRACVSAIDKVGNKSECVAQEEVMIDNDKPYPVEYTTFDETKYYGPEVEFSVSGTDDLSGMYSVSIVIDGAPAANLGSSNTISMSSLNDGTHVIEFLLTDNAGNIYNSADDSNVNIGRVNVDLTNPVVTITEPKDDEYAKDELPVSGEIEDNFQLDHIIVKVDGDVVLEIPVTGAFSEFDENIDVSEYGEGCHLLEIIVVDSAGNESDPASRTFCIDRTIPENVEMETEGTKGEGGVYRGAVTFTGKAEDQNSGIGAIYIDLGLGDGEQESPVTTPDDFSGIIKACVRAVDSVGNSTECIEQEEIMIDNEKPYPVDYTTFDENRAYNGDLSFTVTGTDDLSGMYSVTILFDDQEITSIGDTAETLLGILGDGEHIVEFILRDNAGNIYRSADDDNVNIGKLVVDSTVPEVSVEKPTEGEYAGDTLIITGSASDNIGLEKAVVLIDGEKAAEISLDGTQADFDGEIDLTSLSDGEHTITVIVYDTAENPSEAEERTVIADHTVPECHVEVTGEMGDGGILRGNVTLTAVCTDDGSGVEKEYLNDGSGRVEKEIMLGEEFTGNIDVLVAGIDKVGNDTGDIVDPVYVVNGVEYSKDDLARLRVDNDVPTVKDFFVPVARWLRVEYLDMFVEGKDNEGELYSGTIIINGEEYKVFSDTDRFELRFNIEEGISSLEYYVTDLAGNNSPVVSKNSEGHTVIN